MRLWAAAHAVDDVYQGLVPRVLPGYALVWMLLFASGLGVAMFHPAAGKAARRAAMEGAGEVRKLYAEASAMSIFTGSPTCTRGAPWPGWR